MALWLSSGAFQTRNIQTLLADATERGIRNIELSSGMSSSDDMLEHIRAAHSAGTHSFLVHNYFPPPPKPFVLNVASRDPEGLKDSKNLCRTALQLAKEVGASFYSVHAGFAAALKPELLGRPEAQAATLTKSDIDREKSYEVMVETIGELADYAAELGLELYVENNVISPLYLAKMPINPLLLTEASEIVQFFTDVDRNNVGLLLDVGHARVSATALGFMPESFVDDVAEHIRCLHLSANDGMEDQNLTFEEDAWFIPQLKQFKNCEMVIESYNLSKAAMDRQLEVLARVLA